MTSVRPGRPDDYPQLRSIQRQTLAEPWPALLETAVEGPPPLFVLDDERPVGYVIAIADDGEVVYIPELAVHPDYQEQGNGSLLLSHVIDRFSGFDQVRLTVASEDNRARAFYESHGFEVLERLDEYFESGDGLLLVRHL